MTNTPQLNDLVIVGEMVTDGGRDISSEFYVETNTGDRFYVTDEDYKAVEWVEKEYRNEGDIVNDSVGFDERFAEGLNDYIEDIEPNQAAEKTVTYSAAAGHLISRYFERDDWMNAKERMNSSDVNTDQNKKSVKSLFKDSADKFINDGLVPTLSNVIGKYIPKSGHGMMKPYNRDVDICRDTIVTAAENGFILEYSGQLDPSFYSGNKISCEQCISMLEE